MQPFRAFSSLIILIAALACTRSEEIFQPQSLDELPGHTMAVVEGSVQAEFAERHLRDKGVNLVYYPGFVNRQTLNFKFYALICIDIFQFCALCFVEFY